MMRSRPSPSLSRGRNTTVPPRLDPMSDPMSVVSREPVMLAGQVPSNHRLLARIPLPVALVLGLLSLMPSLPVRAQSEFVPCPAEGRPLVDVPEIKRDAASRILKGVVTLADEPRVLYFKNTDGSIFCAKQDMRYIKGHSADDPNRVWPSSGEPLPGPTLRARVGDVVQLSLLNQIDTSHVPASWDSGQCDTTKEIGTGVEIYPGKTGDKLPNCFHGSSTTNIHFHGTHTTPNTTGDNVFLQIRPSLREDGQPMVTEASVKADFDLFFEQCVSELRRGKGNSPTTWPNLWTELPGDYRSHQEHLLRLSDYTSQWQGRVGLPPDQQLWPANVASLARGEWPANYVGAFPYCFELPEYKAPPQSPDQLQMGQSPGTHWYHAHKHGSTQLNISNAMTGVFIIAGDYDDKLHAFSKNQGSSLTEKVLVIQQLGVTPALQKSAARSVDQLSVNGRRQPVLTMRPGEVQLWRIVNSPARSGVYFVTPSGLEWRQTAQDGVQLAPANYANPNNKNAGFLLAAGNRADLLVRAPMTAGKFPVQIIDTVDVPPGRKPTSNPVLQTLWTVEVAPPSGSGAQAFAPPTKPFPDCDPTTGRCNPDGTEFPQLPPFLEDIEDTVDGKQQIFVRRELIFNSTFGTATSHTIDYGKFGSKVDQAMMLGDTEEWKIINESGSAGPGIAHPFHIHINPFQVVEVFDPNDSRFYQFTDSKNRDRKSRDKCYVDPKDKATWRPCAKTMQPQVNFVWWDVFPMPPALNVMTDGTTPPQGAKACSATNGVPPCFVSIPGYFKMRSRFVDYTGQYVLHCHILAHEDRGMMQFVEVVPTRMKGPHH